MQITNTLRIDMCKQESLQRFRVMQADANTRSVEISLFEADTAWPIPQGVTGALGYRKPDGTAGLYDKLPDGTDALSVEENRITAVLAPQVLTVPGLVRAVITLNDADMRQLSTFPFEIFVQENPVAGTILSENYCYYTNLDAVSKAIGDVSKLKVGENLVSAVNELADKGGVDPEVIREIVEQWMESHPADGSAVRYISQELTEEEKAQARENIGAEAAAGTYELLETIVVTEDVQSIYRELPDLKALTVKFMLPPTTTYSYITVVTEHKNSAETLDTNFALERNDYTRGFRAEMYPAYGFYRQDGYLPSIEYNNVSNALSGPNGKTIAIAESHFICGVTISVLLLEAIPQGTEIMIYGVRANGEN